MIYHKYLLQQNIKLKKTATYTIESINILSSFKDILKSLMFKEEGYIFNVISNLGEIVKSTTNIVTTFMGTEINKTFSKIFNISDLVLDEIKIAQSLQPVDEDGNVDYENGKIDGWAVTSAVASMVLDIVFYKLDCDQGKLEDSIIVTKKVGKQKLYDYTIDSILYGGLTAKEKNELMPGASDLDYDDALYLIFNHPY